MRTPLVAVALGAMLAVASCTGEDATPIDQLDELPGTQVPAVTHALEPNDEMRELAEQQCFDDPELEVGEINAVDPDNPGQVLLTVTVDCADLR